MKDWGTYRKLFEVTSTSFKRLPFGTRGAADELLRYVDRNGRLVEGSELNDQLVDDVAFHVRAHTGEEEFLRRSLEGLLADGYLVFAGGYLVIRNFVPAQRSDSADRMAKKRALDAGIPRDDDPAESDDGDTCDVTDVSDDTTVPSPRGRVVSSRLVSSSSDQGSQSRSEQPTKPRSPAAGDVAPVHLPEDWAPDPRQVTALATKWQTTEARILAEVPEFRWYWREGKGKGKRSNLRGWAQSFGNRMAAMAKGGDLYVEPKARDVGPAPGYRRHQQQSERSGPTHKLFQPEGIEARKAWRKQLYEAALRGEHGSEMLARCKGETTRRAAVDELEKRTPKPLGFELGKVGTDA